MLMGNLRSFDLILLVGSLWNVEAFQSGKSVSLLPRPFVEQRFHLRTSLSVSVGLGPEEDIIHQHEGSPLIDTEEPNHELFRTKRLSDFDRICDEWFGELLGNKDTPRFLGEVSKYALERLHNLVELKDEVMYIFIRKIVP